MKQSTLIIIIFFFLCGVGHARRISIISSVANIRSGPGTKYDILWKAEKYYPLDVFEKKGVWLHFHDFEGDKGWVHKSLVGSTLSVISKKNICNIRSGPDTRFEILFSVGKGIPFKIIERKGNWINILHNDGDRGWIHKSLVW